jgi:hypothetical protein
MKEFSSPNGRRFKSCPRNHDSKGVRRRRLTPFSFKSDGSDPAPNLSPARSNKTECEIRETYESVEGCDAFFPVILQISGVTFSLMCH